MLSYLDLVLIDKSLKPFIFSHNNSFFSTIFNGFADSLIELQYSAVIASYSLQINTNKLRNSFE